MAFYELRQYKVLPGKLEDWVRIMEQEIIPFQVSKGMVICGSFQGETDPSVYIWLRRFESEAHKAALSGLPGTARHLPVCREQPAPAPSRICSRILQMQHPK